MYLLIVNCDCHHNWFCITVFASTVGNRYIITDRIGDKQNVYKQFSLHPEPLNLRVPLAVHKERIQLNYKPNL